MAKTQTQNPPPAETTAAIAADLNQEPENLEDYAGLEWISDFSETNPVISIRLHRYPEGAKVNNQGIPPFLCAYDKETPPTIEQIQQEHGGGAYMLCIQYRDDTTRTKRNLRKVSFVIAGPPKSIPAEINGAPVPAAINNPAGGNIIDTIKTLKDLGLIGNTPAPAADLTLVMKSIEHTNNMVLKMVENKSGGESDALTKLLLDRALDKSTGELETFQKFISLYERTQTAPAENSEIGELVKLAGPLLLAMLTKQGGAQNNGPVQRPVNGRAPAKQLQPPPAAQQQQQPAPDILQAIQNLARNVEAKFNALDDRLSGFESRILNLEGPDLDENLLNDLERYLNEGKSQAEIFANWQAADIMHDVGLFNEYILELGLEPDLVLDKTSNVTEMQVEHKPQENPEMIKALEKHIANQIKAADDTARVNSLKEYVSAGTDPATIYRICIENDVIKDINEFNDYMRRAGLEPISIPA